MGMLILKNIIITLQTCKHKNCTFWGSLLLQKYQGYQSNLFGLNLRIELLAVCFQCQIMKSFVKSLDDI